MADDDVLIKVAADISNASQAMQTMAELFVGLFEGLTQGAAEADEASKKAAEGLKDMGDSAEKSSAMAHAWGELIGKSMQEAQKAVIDLAMSFPKMVTGAAKAGDEMNAMANRLGTTVTAVDRMKFVADQANVSMEGMARAAQGLAVSLNDSESKASKAFERLGLNAEELRKDPEQALYAFVEAVKKIPEQEQAAVFMEGLGGKARMLTGLLKENTGQLQEEYAALALTKEELAALAAEGDAYGDNLGKIQKMQDTFQQRLALAFLPTINEILEKMPELGGAVLTVGETLWTAAEKMGPLLLNLELLGKSKIAGWAVDIAMKVPGATTALGLFKGAVTALQGALVPLAIAIAAVTAAWYIWNQSNKESGFWRDRADDIEWAALRLQGYTDKQAEAMIAEQHARQKTNELAEEQKRLAAALTITAVASHETTVQTEDLADAMAKVQAKLDAIDPKVKEQIKTALEQGKSIKWVHEQTKISEEVLNLYKDQLDAATKKQEALTKAYEQTPIAKFIKSTKELGEEITNAQKSGASMVTIVEKFGKESLEAAKNALLIPGALDKLPPIITEVAQALNTMELKKIMVDIRTETKKTEKEVAASAQAMADATGKNLSQMFVSWTKLSRENEIAQMNAHDAQLARIDDAEQAHLTSLGERTAFNARYHDLMTAEIKKKYDEQRRAMLELTGDIEKDAEKRGQKTKQELTNELGIERLHLANMLAHREEFTDKTIEDQKRGVKEREEALKGEQTLWAKMPENAKKAFGGVSTALDSTADSFARLATIGNESMGKLASGMALGATLMGDVSGLLEAKDTIGLIIAAAKLAVDAIMGMWDAFNKSPGEDVVGRVGHRLGVVIGEELGDTIAATAKEKFKGDKFAAEVFHLTDIIEAAGGVTKDNFDKLLGGLRDTFVLIEQGTVTVDEGREILDKSFGQFAEHVVESGEIASKSFAEMLKLNAQLGTSSKEMAAFVETQTTRLGSALGTLMAPFTTAVTKANDLREAIATGETALQAELAKGTKADQDRVAAMRLELAKLNNSYQEVSGSIQDSGATLQRFELLSVAAFNAAIESGAGYVDAINQLSPALDQIIAGHEAMGTTGGAAIQELLKFREVTQANQELVEGTGALNEVMLALSNIGGLNEETFKALQEQGNETFADLTAAGFTEQQSLQQMKTYLESVKKGHKELGLPIDENTERLLEQAEASGVLRKEEMTTNDIMMEGLGAIIEALGGKVPDAFKKMATSAQDAAKGISTAVTDDVTGSVDGLSTEMSEVPFDVFAEQAQMAAVIAEQEFHRAAASVGDVSTLLDDTDWKGWASDAVKAANSVKEAVDEVSFGSSPGGIKEIPLQLKKSSDASRQFAAKVASDMARVKSDVEQIGGPNASGSVGFAGGAAAYAGGGGGDVVNFTFEIRAIDSQDMSRAVENQILPKMLETLRRGRNLTTLRELVR